MAPAFGGNVDALAVREAHVGDQAAFQQLAKHPPAKPRQQRGESRASRNGRECLGAAPRPNGAQCRGGRAGSPRDASGCRVDDAPRAGARGGRRDRVPLPRRTDARAPAGGGGRGVLAGVLAQAYCSPLSSLRLALVTDIRALGRVERPRALILVGAISRRSSPLAEAPSAQLSAGNPADRPLRPAGQGGPSLPPPVPTLGGVRASATLYGERRNEGRRLPFCPEPHAARADDPSFHRITHQRPSCAVGFRPGGRCVPCHGTCQGICHMKHPAPAGRLRSVNGRRLVTCATARRGPW